jgi:NAD(P)H-dependent flavin oxidoreductase YrpB (nitropropane dioxygenase family)
MNVAAGPELAAAVTNAGGLGVIGGVGYTPKILRQQVGTARASLKLCRALTRYLIFATGTSQIKALKKDLKDPNAPFGVDLLLPQVGGSARKTNVRHLTSASSRLVSSHL